MSRCYLNVNTSTGGGDPSLGVGDGSASQCPLDPRSLYNNAFKRQHAFPYNLNTVRRSVLTLGVGWSCILASQLFVRQYVPALLTVPGQSPV